MELKNTHNPDDAFCLYCQKQYVSVMNLNRHIKAKHEGTIVYWSLIKSEEEAMMREIDKHDF